MLRGLTDDHQPDTMKPRLAIFQLKRLKTILKCTDKVSHSALEETDLLANNNNKKKQTKKKPRLRVAFE